MRLTIFSALVIGVCSVILHPFQSIAQLPDGSVAPDWTLTDIYGNDHSLQSSLDSGYAVILHFQFTWDAIGWDLHNSGLLESLYQELGPTGENILRVFLIETDPNTTTIDLFGGVDGGSGTQGDWTEGITYPVIDNGQTVAASYEVISFSPAVFMVCPSGTLVDLRTNDFNFFEGTGWQEGYIKANCGFGCTNQAACNYDFSATSDDGSCTYAQEYRDCNGECLQDVNNDGICDIYENFERFNELEGIAVQSAYWDTWFPNTASMDAPIIQVNGMDEVIQSSLLVSPPSDVIFKTNHAEPCRFEFDMFIPPGNAGYYNVQEFAEPAVAWGYECFFQNDGTFEIRIDEQTVFSTEFQHGSWFTVSNEIDPVAGFVNFYLNGILVGQFPYDGQEIGSINFYPAGPGSFFVDQLRFQTTNAPLSLLKGGCLDPLACNYDASANWDDGSCCFCIAGDVSLDATWKLSPEAASIMVGTEVDPGAYYVSSNNLPFQQLNDEWTFTSEGTFMYENGGATIYPFDGQYIDFPASFSSTDYVLEMSSESLENGVIHLGEQQVFGSILPEGISTCGWMGVWDSGPDYTILSINESQLVLQSDARLLTPEDPLSNFTDCLPDEGVVFTLTFIKSGLENYPACAMGCTDILAFNYDENAIENDGSCFYATCQDVGSPEWANLPESVGVYLSSADSLIVGEEAVLDFVVHLDNVIYDVETSFSDLEISGLPPGFEVNLEESYQVNGGQQLCISLSGTPTTSGEFSVQFSFDLYTPLIFETYYASANIYIPLEVFQSNDFILGCTYNSASNFDPLASTDDGSCLFDFTPSTCSADLDGNGQVGTPDLLSFLTQFGAVCN